ncbi:hypothetical protein [Larkinella rosea]|uniref:Uncharacterized protein n=1 Tax=Larkinella rosea TaxID=2025312 RepID=A0A3P1BQ47_9BACT|nr:hypothetical protein EHT25_20230 [Larkinella rosea]
MGDTTMAFAVGKTGLVLAFDPNPLVFKILEKNASLNKDQTNIEPHRMAIAPMRAITFIIPRKPRLAMAEFRPLKTARTENMV